MGHFLEFFGPVGDIIGEDFTFKEKVKGSLKLCLPVV
jgi:hypothetical protein